MGSQDAVVAEIMWRLKDDVDAPLDIKSFLEFIWC